MGIYSWQTQVCRATREYRKDAVMNFKATIAQASQSTKIEWISKSNLTCYSCRWWSKGTTLSLNFNWCDLINSEQPTCSWTCYIRQYIGPSNCYDTSGLNLSSRKSLENRTLMPSSDFSFLLTRYLAGKCDISIYNTMLIVWYLAVGLACIFYDHVLTLDNELKYIWKRGHWDFIKFYFICNRCFAEAGLILGAYRKSGECQCLRTLLPVKDSIISFGRRRRQF